MEGTKVGDTKENETYFYLHKDKAKEFQNRCVIAIFLLNQGQPKITFGKYLGTNCFVGMIDEKETVIYLFETPEKDATPGCVFRARNRKTTENAHQYYAFSSEFMEEYCNYRENVYDYIIEHFFDDWRQYLGTLFISDPPKENVAAYKYKEAGEMEDIYKNKEAEKIEDIYKKKDSNFKKFLDGEVVFSNPEGFNDPFDCDCELADEESQKRLLWNAFNSMKYSGKGSCGVRWADVDSIDPDAESEIEDTIKKIIEEGKKDDAPQSKKSIDTETSKDIADIHARMLEQIKNLKEKFRVYCSTDRPDDILMWGYYGNGGKGVCCKYMRENILEGIRNSRRQFICVYGNVEYSDSKPKYNYVVSDLADNIFDYVIRCVFTKYSGWKHENEFRYVLLEKEFESDHIVINVEVEEYFAGCKMKDKDQTQASTNNSVNAYLASKTAPTRQIEKAKDKYELIY